MDLGILFAVSISTFSAGFLIPAYLELKRVRKELDQKVNEFGNITKQASEANLSFANKVLQLEEKISTLEFWKSNNSFKK